MSLFHKHSWMQIGRGRTLDRDTDLFRPYVVAVCKICGKTKDFSQREWAAQEAMQKYRK